MASPGATAVTGLGIVSSLGADVQSFGSALLSGTCAIGSIADLTRPDQPVKIGSPVRDFDPAAHFSPRTLSQIDRFTQFAAVAARQAWAQAGHDAQAGSGAAQVPRHRIGVAIGSSVAGLDILDIGFRRILLEGRRPDMLTIPMTMGNAPVSRIAFETGARGPSFGINSACASAAHAILFGHKMVLSGLADIFIVGGTDSCFSDGFLRAWASLRMLSPEPCRPFSSDRRGISMGEGAAVLVLESVEMAARRGGPIHGYLRGGGLCGDACGILSPDASGMAFAMKAALDDAGLVADHIDYLNAHGTGTLANDRAEAAAIVEVFGARSEPVKTSSSKSMIGHCMGASGALEAVATLLALKAQIAPPTVNVTAPAPDCPIDITPVTPAAWPMRLAMSNSFGFGGMNAALVFERAE